MTIQKIRGKVNIIIEKLKIEDAPTPLEKVAEFFALPIVYYPKFPDSISGTVIQEEDLLAIGVNDKHPRVRQRFTIAHELGHYILGHDTSKILDDKFDKDSDKEKEANKFASELLMPIEILKRDLSSKKWNIPSLAKRYEVSEQAMTIRLMEANLINNTNLQAIDN